MNRSVTVIAGALLVSLCWAGPSAAQVVLPAGPSLAVDRDGRLIGEVIDEARTPLLVDGRSVLVTLFPEGFQYTGRLLFDANDCSGVPLIESSGPRFFDYAVTVGPGHMLWSFVPGSEPHVTQPRSVRRGDEECNPGAIGSLTVQEARLLVDLDQLFVPPFRLTTTPFTLIPACPGDLNGDRHVTVDELVTSVNSALGGCPTSAAPQSAAGTP